VQLKIVADTNVLISALGWQSNEFKLIEKCMKKEINLIISLEIIEEFRKVAIRPKFDFSLDEIEDFIDALIEVGEVVQPQERVKIVEDDPSDNKIIECALEGKANYIVTGDAHLLKLKEINGIKIVKSREIV